MHNLFKDVEEALTVLAIFLYDRIKFGTEDVNNNLFSDCGFRKTRHSGSQASRQSVNRILLEYVIRLL
jgi:hypothetical protein